MLENLKRVILLCQPWRGLSSSYVAATWSSNCNIQHSLRSCTGFCCHVHCGNCNRNRHLLESLHNELLLTQQLCVMLLLLLLCRLHRQHSDDTICSISDEELCPLHSVFGVASSSNAVLHDKLLPWWDE